VDTHVFPAAEKDLARLSLLQNNPRKSEITNLYDELWKCRTALEQVIEETSKIHDEVKKANGLASKVIPAMQAVRNVADELEGKVADEHWTLPKYREMLFLR
jgi:glutamine synthetase